MRGLWDIEGRCSYVCSLAKGEGPADDLKRHRGDCFAIPYELAGSCSGEASSARTHGHFCLLWPGVAQPNRHPPPRL